jgi:hypothetical protein
VALDPLVALLGRLSDARRALLGSALGVIADPAGSLALASHRLERMVELARLVAGFDGNAPLGSGTLDPLALAAVAILTIDIYAASRMPLRARLPLYVLQRAAYRPGRASNRQLSTTHGEG